MKLTEPTEDTTEILLLNAINALRIAGQDKFADDLNERLEAIVTQPKIAIYVKGGMVEAIRSNIGQDLDVEVVDADGWDDEKHPEDRWEEVENELEFGNY